MTVPGWADPGENRAKFHIHNIVAEENFHCEESGADRDAGAVHVIETKLFSRHANAFSRRWRKKASPFPQIAPQAPHSALTTNDQHPIAKPAVDR